MTNLTIKPEIETVVETITHLRRVFLTPDGSRKGLAHKPAIGQFYHERGRATVYLIIGIGYKDFTFSSISYTLMVFSTHEVRNKEVNESWFTREDVVQLKPSVAVEEAVAMKQYRAWCIAMASFIFRIDREEGPEGFHHSLHILSKAAEVILDSTVVPMNIRQMLSSRSSEYSTGVCACAITAKMHDIIKEHTHLFSTASVFHYFRNTVGLLEDQILTDEHYEDDPCGVRDKIKKLSKSVYRQIT